MTQHVYPNHLPRRFLIQSSRVPSLESLPSALLDPIPGHRLPPLRVCLESQCLSPSARPRAPARLEHPRLPRHPLAVCLAALLAVISASESRRHLLLEELLLSLAVVSSALRAHQPQQRNPAAFLAAHPQICHQDHQPQLEPVFLVVRAAPLVVAACLET